MVEGNNPEKIQEIKIDREWLQKVQDFYADISGLFLFAIDKQGRQITDISGRDIRETARIADLINKNQVEDLFRRVMYTRLEEQIIENTEYSNMKLAAVAVKVKSEAILCFMIAGVYKVQDGENAILNMRSVVDERVFFGGIDYVREIFDKVYSSEYRILSENKAEERALVEENEIRENLSKTESLNEIVQLLDSDESYEKICDKVVKIAAGAAHISHCYVIQRGRYDNTIEALGKYRSESSDPIIEKVNPVEVLKYAGKVGDKPMVVSSRTEIDYDFRLWIGALGIIAFVALPVFRTKPSKEVSNYLIFADNDPKKVWTRDDIKFFGEISKVLQSIFDRHIHKLSIVASYNALTFVLNNVGSAIFVKDIQTGQLLFKNRSFEKGFAEEIAKGTIQDIFGEEEDDLSEDKRGDSFELSLEDGERWYDVNKTPMQWVDGRNVLLFSIYDITDKKLYQKKIEQQANSDYLTGLYNRMNCEKDLSTHIEECRKDGKKACLLYLDLDDFKHINDGLGHQYGDELLKTISGKINEIEGIKNSCYRIGGDEFIAIIPPDHYEEKPKILETIREMFNSPWYLNGGDYYCTSSIGVVDFPDSDDNVQEIIKKADIAMYESKRSGKNRTTYYKKQDEDAASYRLDMEKNMRNATFGAIREFEIFYQPIIDVSKGNVCTGAEALLRWNSKSMGFLTPGEFIPLAEYLGLINPIGNYILMKACSDCKKWNESGHPYYKVNVNLSVVQLLQNDIVGVIEKTINETGINPRNLVIEVTESLAINDIDKMKKILFGIKALGCRIALDDFGTGYSSLNHIRELPIDLIKVDQTFVTDLVTDPYAQSFIKMVGELASSLNVKICVEGIESREQKEILDKLDVNLIQGFFYDQPMKKEEFEAKYVNNCIGVADFKAIGLISTGEE